MQAASLPRASRLVPVLLVLLAIVSVQVGASIAKSLFPAVGAAGAAALRLALGTAMLLIVFRPWRTPLRGLPWRSLLGYGLSLGTMNGLFYQALATVPIGIAVALEFTGPLTLAVLGSRRPRDFLWIVLAVVGLLLLVPWSESQQGVDPLGAAFALAAGACWALYIVFGGKVGAEHGTQSVALGAVIAACVVVPWGVADAGGKLLDPALLPAALGVAALSMALPYTLEMMALPRMPASTFGMMMSLEPAVGALAGLIFLQEVLSLLQWLAIGAVIMASAGAALTAPADTPAATVPD
ncbi:EamA family transporter [Pseudoxanthomonas composti]|uniref:EamA family transporter n=1 Tax=Pseudoxanthomonas composti TaxID=2137479 RepID=A0A4Q1JUZ2_9GAMM|nr:EamA family transporter [Pseudoxanthomonas composti]RXR03407.1 EamA family transporter [Pseudoxanthomonas composti]